MATYIRTIRNERSVSIELTVPGINPSDPIVLAPSASVDLLTVISEDELETMQPFLSELVSAGTITSLATVDSTNLHKAEADTISTSGTNEIDGTLITYKDNATSFRLKGPQHTSEGGADVQSYAGIFYNDGYDTLGVLKTRASFGANIEMDLAIQSPHALMLLAVDGTQTDGVLLAASQTNFVFHARADAETNSPKQLIIDRVSTASTGLANTSDINLKTNDGSIYLNSGVTTGAVVVPVLTTGERDALSGVAGMVIFNSTTSKHQGYDGSIWNDLY